MDVLSIIVSMATSHFSLYCVRLLPLLCAVACNTVLHPQDATFRRDDWFPLPAPGSEDIVFLNNLLLGDPLVPHTCLHHIEVDIGSCLAGNIELSALNNWWVGQPSPAVDTAAISGTPAFVDPPVDYSLMPGPGCGTGAPAVAVDPDSQMTTDYFARPWHPDLDIGALRCPE